MSLETGFLYLFENFLYAHSLMESMTLHMGRTGFPVCLFPNESKHFLSSLQSFQPENVTVAHSLKNIPPDSGLSSSRMMCVHFHSQINKQEFDFPHWSHCLKRLLAVNNLY